MIQHLRLVKIDNQTQLHHTTCGRRNTKILSWTDEVPAKILIEEIVDAINEHTCVEDGSIDTDHIRQFEHNALVTFNQKPHKCDDRRHCNP